MRGAENIIPVMSLLVSQMTPVITITDNVADGDNWKLSMCRTYWLTGRMKITIGGEVYTIVSFEMNDHIIVSGPIQPVVTSFQLSAPVFWHGSHRKVNGELGKEKDLTPPIVYLPVPEVEEVNRYDSDIAYIARIKPLFLRSFKTELDNIDFQQVDVIEPMNQMADLFLSLINDQDDKFNRPENIVAREWMNFGNPTIWGNDKLIFNQNLSGVERRLTLEVLPDGVCDCSDTEPEVCAPVAFYMNDVYQMDIPSGDDFKIQVVDTNNDPVVADFDEVEKKIIVPIGGGGAQLYNVISGGVSQGTITFDGTNKEIDVY